MNNVPVAQVEEFLPLLKGKKVSVTDSTGFYSGKETTALNGLAKKKQKRLGIISNLLIFQASMWIVDVVVF